MAWMSTVNENGGVKNRQVGFVWFGLVSIKRPILTGAKLCLWGGIFTVKILTFSGKSAEKVMGVNGFECPAIFWDQECSTFWGVVDDVLEH